MGILDFIEIWWLSVKPLLESNGAIGQFKRSSDDIENPSCSLNVIFGTYEIDLLVWKSREAEFLTMDSDGMIEQEHFDDIKHHNTLVIILSRIASLALPA